MGIDIAQGALGAGHAIVATGRNSGAVSDAVGDTHDLEDVRICRSLPRTDPHAP